MWRSEAKSKGFCGPRSGQGHEGQVEEAEHADPEAQAARIRTTIQDLDAIRQAPMRQETTPRLTKEKETSLHQSRPQRVSKAKRFSNASVKSLSDRQRRGTGPPRSLDQARSKRRPAPRRQQPAHEIIKTRSGRISMSPVRWAPERKPYHIGTVLGQKFPTAPLSTFYPPTALNYQLSSCYFDVLKLRTMITYIIASTLG